MLVIENDAETLPEEDHQLKKPERIDHTAFEKQRVGGKGGIGGKTIGEVGLDGISNVDFTLLRCKHARSPISLVFPRRLPGTALCL